MTPKSIQRSIAALVLCVVSLPCCASVRAQQSRTFEMGQAVEIFCNCFGDNAWTPGRIESIDENGYVVRYGDGRFQTKAVKFGSDRIRDPNRPAAPAPRRNSSGQVMDDADSGQSNQTAAQETEFKVGDMVEVNCGNCKGNKDGWVRAKIVKIDFDRRFYIYDFGDVNHRGEPKYYQANLSNPDFRTLTEERDGQVRAQFEKEAQPYSTAVEQMAFLHDPKLTHAEYRLSPEELEKHRASLKALDAVCRKYPNLRNSREANKSGGIGSRYTDWCEMAKHADALVDKGKAAKLYESVAGDQALWLDELKYAFQKEGGMKEETQRIVFDRAAWEREIRARLKNAFGNVPEETLKEYFGEIFAEADKVKAQIEQTAPTKSWDAPTLHNAALEGMVRSYYARITGAQVLKIGMYQNDYKLFKNNLGIPTSQVISGVALVKIANRPFCQSQIFELHKEYMGGGRWSAVKPIYIGRAGTFVQCR